MRGRAHTRSTRGVAGANAGEEEAAATLYVFFFFLLLQDRDTRKIYFLFWLFFFFFFFLGFFSLFQEKTINILYIRHVPYTLEKGEL